MVFGDAAFLEATKDFSAKERDLVARLFGFEGIPLDKAVHIAKSTLSCTTRAQATSELSATLEQRGKRYGVFADHARITQAIKRTMRESAPEAWEKLPDDAKEALEMLAHKIGRILNGDPLYADSWVDLAGYAQLVATRLQTEHPDHQ